MALTIGFTGLGRMGKPIATNMIKAGIAVNFYARSEAKARQGFPEAEKSKFYPTVADLAKEHDILVAMVLDDHALEEVLFDANGAAAAMKPGSIVLSLAFNSPDYVVSVTKKLTDLNLQFISAPVFGRPEAAEHARLLVAPGGPAAAVEKCMPIFKAISQKVLPVGEDQKKAVYMKTLGNFLVATVVEGLSEATVLSRKLGIDGDLFVTLMQSLFPVGPVGGYAAQINTGVFDSNVGASAAVGLKDVGIMLSLAREYSVPLPIADISHEHLRILRATGRVDHDWAGVAEVLAEQAGITLKPTQQQQQQQQQKQ